MKSLSGVNLSGTVGGTRYTAEIFGSSAKGLTKVDGSIQSNLQPGKPWRPLPERDAIIVGVPWSLRRLAIREAVLPVPPVRRIVISAEAIFQ